MKDRLRAAVRPRQVVVVAVLLLALLQRLSAAYQLPVDADESVYAWTASYYAGLMARGEWREIPAYTYNSEHPVFAKLLYALGLRVVGHAGLPDQAERPPGRGFLEWGEEAGALGVYHVDRVLAALLGTLQVTVLALADPLAGLLLSSHTMTIKYTAEIYLEALPACAITGAVLAYERAHRQGEGETGGWFWLSAGLLGLTAASKYTYAVIGLALVPFVLWQQRRRPGNVLLYGLLALAVFGALNPILWPDPLGRLRDSLLYHGDYTRSAEVARYHYPWWQPLNWMGGAAVWHPVFWFPFDIVTFLFSLAGLPFLFRRHKLYFAWYVVGWLFLFLWPTKWPQYTLIVTPALCLSVGALGQAVAERYDLHLDRETWERIKFYLPDETFWIKPSKSLLIGVSVLLLLYVVGSVVFRIQQTRQLRGWTTYTALQRQVVSDSITALALDADERVWIGTRQGITVYEAENPVPTSYRAADSGLLDERVTALVLDREERMWVGAETGVSVYDDGAWTAYPVQEMGLPGSRVRALAADPVGRVWVGALGGAALWDGSAWRTFSPLEAGLDSGAVLALAVDGAGRVWMGTERGLAVLDLGSGEPAWIRYTAASSGLTVNSVVSLLAVPGARDEVWIGTDGGGLCHFYSGAWDCYRTANSDIPWNTIAALALDHRGRIWAATEKPAHVGGAVVCFDGERWREYTPSNSGLVGSVVTTILQDAEGRYWFGTLHDGVSIYEHEGHESHKYEELEEHEGYEIRVPFVF
ncbi:MAG TPA: hypothetical protein ENN99_14030 [Chloroflexi bacterium]|nr:hypothetical protein [Chloroflexota bacterium]